MTGANGAPQDQELVKGEDPSNLDRQSDNVRHTWKLIGFEHRSIGRKQ